MKDIKIKPVVFAMAQELARVLKLRTPNEVVTHLLEKEYKERRL